MSLTAHSVHAIADWIEARPDAIADLDRFVVLEAARSHYNASGVDLFSDFLTQREFVDELARNGFAPLRITVDREPNQPGGDFLSELRAGRWATGWFLDFGRDDRCGISDAELIERMIELIAVDERLKKTGRNTFSRSNQFTVHVAEDAGLHYVDIAIDGHHTDAIQARPFRAIIHRSGFRIIRSNPGFWRAAFLSEPAAIDDLKYRGSR